MFPEWYFDYYEPFPRQFSQMPNYPMKPSTQKPQQTQQSTQEGQDQNFPSNFDIAPGSPTELGVEYTQGYLKTQIGKRMRVTFLLGTNLLQDREGTLEKVGISYIIIREIDTNVRTLCDIYSIKFAAIFQN